METALPQADTKEEPVAWPAVSVDGVGMTNTLVTTTVPRMAVPDVAGEAPWEAWDANWFREPPSGALSVEVPSAVWIGPSMTMPRAPSRPRDDTNSLPFDTGPRTGIEYYGTFDANARLLSEVDDVCDTIWH